MDLAFLALSRLSSNGEPTARGREISGGSRFVFVKSRAPCTEVGAQAFAYRLGEWKSQAVHVSGTTLRQRQDHFAIGLIVVCTFTLLVFTRALTVLSVSSRRTAPYRCRGHPTVLRGILPIRIRYLYHVAHSTSCPQRSRHWHKGPSVLI